MNKRTLIAITLVLGLILGIGFGTSTVSADIDLNNLTWSVQSLVDESEQVFGQCQNFNPRSVRGLALSHDGNYLYLSYLQDPDYAGRVRKIDLSEPDFEDQVVNELQLIDHRPGTPFTSAKALAVDDEGRVYMARGDGIQIWDADLGLGGSWVAGTEGGSILPQFTLTGLNDSRGVALTREGGTLVMYVSDSGDDTLERYELTESAGSVTGATRVGFGANATDVANNGELNLPGAVKPIGLEVAPDGTIWIADQSAGQVYRVNPDGTLPSPSSVSVTGAFDVAFDGNTALVSNGGGTVEAFNVADMSVLTTVIPPFAALELRSLPGTNTALTGIDAITDDAFYVAIEDGERPDQTIEGCADDADDNAPVLKATVDAPPTNATITIKVSDNTGTGHEGYTVQVYEPGATYAFASQVSDDDGLTTFELDALTDYEYTVTWGRKSARVPFSTWGDATLEYKLAKVDIKVEGDGPESYNVQVYAAEQTYAFTNQNVGADGTMTAYLVDGDYEYTVSWGRKSARVDFTVDPPNDADDQTLTYNLAKVDITVAGNGSTSYNVQVYAAGQTYAFTNQDVNANGTMTVYLVDGDYEHTVSWGRKSARVDFTVTRTVAGSDVTCDDQSLTYNLAKVDIEVKGGGSASYNVQVYAAGQTYAFTNQDVNANGTMTVYLVDGDYEYTVSWGRKSARVDFTVTRTVAPPAVTCDNQSLTYELAKVDIEVEGDGPESYNVQVYAAGQTYAFTNQNVNANGTMTVYLVDGDFQYTVSWGRKSARVDFTVTRTVAPPAVTCDNQSLTYELAEITIEVVNKNGQGLADFRVDVYVDGATYPFTNQNTPSNGEVVFYLVDGDYEYRVRKGCYDSGRVDFTVTRSISGDVVTAQDQTITHEATVNITIKVSDNTGTGHEGYKVEVYNPGAAYSFDSQTSDVNGETTFILDALTDYEYTVKYDASRTQKSARVGFSTCVDATLDYKLAKVDITVAGGGLASYKVEVYTKGNDYSFTSESVAAGGKMTVYLVDGDYQYTVKYDVDRGQKSARVDFTVTRTQSGDTVTCADKSLTYDLAAVEITVAGSGSASYKVEVYTKNNDYSFTSESVAAGGKMTVYLVDGDYQYSVKYDVQRGQKSARVDFTVTRTESGDTVTCDDKSLTYDLAEVKITVAGSGSASYKVEVYTKDNDYSFTSESVAAGSTMTIYLVDGDYQYSVKYDVDRGQKSARVDFTVTRTESGDTVTCADKSLTYDLAEVEITVAGGGSASYKVEVYTKDNDYSFTSESVAANGTMTLYLVDGDYQYTVKYDVQRGQKSARVDFTVTRTESGDTVTCADKSLTYNLAKITIKVVNKRGQGLPDFKVEVYTKANDYPFTNQVTPSNGEVVFYLVDGDYEYRVRKDCYDSGRVDFKVTRSVSGDVVTAQDQTITHKATVNVIIKVSDNEGDGHKSYLVRIYKAGGSQVAYQWSDSNGLTNFELDAPADYEYLVEKNGAKSQKYPVSGCQSQSLEYKLAKVTVHVSDSADGDHKSYLVRVYNDGAGQWGYQWSNSSGMTTFYLIEGNYEYLVEKNRARSAKIDFTVDPPNDADDQDLEYQLATVTVKVGDSSVANPGHKSYLVRIYNDDAGQWGYQWSDSTGMTTFYLIEGNYEYLVEKNRARSARIDFTVADTDHNIPTSGNPDDQNLEYQLATVTVKVGDSSVANPGHKSYLVRIYNDNAGQWGYQWSNSSGMTTFYLIEGNYEYLVEKNRARSARIDFTVADTDHNIPTSGNPDDQNLEYKLATVTVKVGDSSVANPGHKSYLVRIYNDDAGQWGYQWSDSTGMTTFYLIEGKYEYLVEKNRARSARIDFTVADTDHLDPISGNPNDQNLEYKLAKVTIHVQDSGGSPLKSYLVRMYNYPAGSQWGYAWTNSSGDSIFYLIEGSYQYRVEKNGYKSDKLPTGGFTVAVLPPGDDQTHTHTVP